MINGIGTRNHRADSTHTAEIPLLRGAGADVEVGRSVETAEHAPALNAPRWRVHCPDLRQPAANALNGLRAGASRVLGPSTVRSGGNLGLRIGGTLAGLDLYERYLGGKELTPQLVGKLLEYFTNEVKPYEGLSEILGSLVEEMGNPAFLRFPEKLADYTTYALGALAGIAADHRSWFWTRHVGEGMPEDCLSAHTAHLPAGCPNRNLDALAVGLRPAFAYVAWSCLLGVCAGIALNYVAASVKDRLSTVMTKVDEIAHGLSVKAFTEPAKDMLRGSVDVAKVREDEESSINELVHLAGPEAGNQRSRESYRSIKRKLHKLLELNDDMRHADASTPEPNEPPTAV